MKNLFAWASKSGKVLQCSRYNSSFERQSGKLQEAQKSVEDHTAPIVNETKHSKDFQQAPVTKRNSRVKKRIASVKHEVEKKAAIELKTRSIA